MSVVDVVKPSTKEDQVHLLGLKPQAHPRVCRRDRPVICETAHIATRATSIFGAGLLARSVGSRVPPCGVPHAFQTLRAVTGVPACRTMSCSVEPRHFRLTSAPIKCQSPGP